MTGKTPSPTWLPRSRVLLPQVEVCLRLIQNTQQVSLVQQGLEDRIAALTRQAPSYRSTETRTMRQIHLAPCTLSCRMRCLGRVQDHSLLAPLPGFLQLQSECTGRRLSQKARTRARRGLLQ